MGLFASTTAVALLFIADDTIKTSGDISDYLGATTIGVIPNVGDEKEKRARTEKRGKKEVTAMLHVQTYETQERSGLSGG